MLKGLSVSIEGEADMLSEKIKRAGIRQKTLAAVVLVTVVMLFLMSNVRGSIVAFWILRIIMIVSLCLILWFLLGELFAPVKDIIAIGKQLSTDLFKEKSDLTARVTETDRSDQEGFGGSGHRRMDRECMGRGQCVQRGPELYRERANPRALGYNHLAGLMDR